MWVDLWSRRVVGWHLADHVREELVMTALRRALLGRQPADGLILHRSGDPVRPWGTVRFQRIPEVTGWQVFAKHEPGR